MKTADSLGNETKRNERIAFDLVASIYFVALFVAVISVVTAISCFETFH